MKNLINFKDFNSKAYKITSVGRLTRDWKDLLSSKKAQDQIKLVKKLQGLLIEKDSL